MGDTTNISWCDHTFNAWIGCARVSPACNGCYAAFLMDTRFGRVTWGGPGKGQGTRERTSDANWGKPRTWDRKAARVGNRPFVFCNSLADVFDNQVPAEWRRDLFDLIRATPHLVWLLLTKRPQNIVKRSESAGGLPRNAALGTTVEDRARMINLSHLGKAALILQPVFTFGSLEPLLDNLRMDDVPYGDGLHGLNALTGKPFVIEGVSTNHPAPPDLPALGWVITGGESDQGPHPARPSDPASFRSIRNQCAAAGVPYHHKQNGEWVDYSEIAGGWEFTRSLDGERYGRLDRGIGASRKTLFDGKDFPSRYPFPASGRSVLDTGPCMVKVGRENSGRTIDGVEHDAFPAIRRMAA